MAALITARDTVEVANGTRTLVLPVKDNTTIYQGSMVALDKNGFAVPAKKAVNLTAAGRAEETVINSGSNGELSVKVSRGVFVWDNTTTAANKLGPAHVLGLCYMEDDQTVSALETDSSVAGRVIRVEDDGVAVQIGGLL